MSDPQPFWERLIWNLRCFNVWRWTAYHMPRRIVYYALVRAWAHANSGPWRESDATESDMATVMMRWDNETHQNPWR